DIISWYFPREDMIRAKKNTGWGYMNLEGETVIPFIYRSLGPVFNGRLSLFDNGQWGWLNAKGEIITAACFDEVGWWNDTLWWARKHGRYSLYDLAGAVVRDEGWTKILTPDRELAVVKTGSYWKYINHAFETVLQLPPIYDGVEYFNEGFAAVKRNGAWGFIDRNGREVIAPVYEQVGFFSEGLASVRQGGDWGYIDRAGIMVIPCRYGFAASFKNGRARVRDKWYSSWYINQQGETVAVIELLYGDG
ncbi:MAG TPA: WG repeat-containing protein, partial [Chitinophagaceae bacterium]|nr:WG repeat-containing protein [Chitinophagaceae bacterium]